MPGFQTLSKIETGHPVCGVAQVHHRIFVVCLESPRVFVFSNSAPYSRLDDIYVDQMNDPNDITASPDTGNLYIADWGMHCVWRLSDVISDKPQAVKWITSVSPWAVSVGPTGRVLVTPRIIVDKSTDNPGSLYLYRQQRASDDELQSDCELQDEVIPLPTGVNVEHAVETLRHTFVMCHTRDAQQDDQSIGCYSKAAISELSSSGEVMRSFEICRGEGPLEWPRHVIIVFPVGAAQRSSVEADSSRRIGSDHHLLLVCDFNSDRVVMFDDQLQLTSVVLTGCDVSQPRRLSFDSSTGHLLVGQYNGVISLLKIAADSKPIVE